jgi:ketosteroid isomerase-like protein
MTKNQLQKNIKIIREILKNEIDGDIQSALKKMHKDYSMTWMYKNKAGVIFPCVRSKDIKKEMRKVYIIKNRKYNIKHIIAQGNVVMAEMIESYPNPKTKKIHRTPMVVVWEFKNGKIFKGRHYCDPQISYIDW